MLNHNKQQILILSNILESIDIINEYLMEGNNVNIV